MLPDVDTEITYPAGATASTGIVLHVEALPDGRHAVLLDRTAFHPVDTAWPDQPSDRGVLRTAAGELPILGAVVAGIHDGTVLLGSDVPVRTGTEGWVFAVAHLVEGGPPTEGEEVAVEVDADRRRSLSRGHSACHLAALALDRALADRWTKPVQVDGLGAPAFDALAIQRSRIVPDGSVDTYRIGRSLRKKGFDVAGFDAPDLLAARIDEVLAGWVRGGGGIRIDREGPGLSDRRSWICALPEATATIPCGGTHVQDVADLGAVHVRFAVEAQPGALEVVMTTTVVGPTA